MKKSVHRFLLLFIYCSNTVVAYGQRDYYIGATAGISVPNLKAGSDNPLSNGFETSLGADFGILAEFPINKWLSIQPGINYTQEGGRHTGMQPFINPYTEVDPRPYLYADYKSSIRLNYLMFPVTAKFNFKLAEDWNFYTNVGGFASFALGGKLILAGDSKIYLDAEGKQEQQVYPGLVYKFDDKQDIKDSIRRFNAGAIIFVGFSYKTGRGKYFIETGANYGFIPVQLNPDNGTNYAGAVTVHLGYEYLIRRKRKK